MSHSAAGVSSRSGFTLIEILIALGVLTIGIGSAIALFTSATASHRRAIDRENAVAIAEHVFSNIEGALHHGARVEELVANPPLEAVERRWPGYGIEIRYGKAPEVGGYVDELLVEVRISWQSRGMAKAERFRQIIVRSRSTRLPRLSP